MAFLSLKITRIVCLESIAALSNWEKDCFSYSHKLPDPPFSKTRKEVSYILCSKNPKSSANLSPIDIYRQLSQSLKTGKSKMPG